MIIGEFTQHPTERKRYTIDYSDWLDTGEQISQVIGSATPVTANPLLVDGASFDGTATKASVFVSGGDDGETYIVVVQIHTSGGQIKEDCIVFSIGEC